KDAMITCVTCGLTYSVSQGRDSCARCPLHEDCSTSCCPKCGTSNINPDKSRLARWLQRILTPRLAQGTDDRWLPAGYSVSEPVEARQAQGADSPLAEPVEATVTEPIEAQQSPALRQAQGTDDRWLPAGYSVSEPVEAQQSPALRQAQGTKKQRTLADVPPGCEVQVTSYGDLNGSQRQHLQGYGLLPGRRVKVLSQHPVTIVQVEQTELAFERGVAVRVLVGD
ncbi:MAG: FeoA family protein, partial [Bellilinea sp.]